MSTVSVSKYVLVVDSTVMGDSLLIEQQECLNYSLFKTFQINEAIKALLIN